MKILAAATVAVLAAIHPLIALAVLVYAFAFLMVWSWMVAAKWGDENPEVRR